MLDKLHSFLRVIGKSCAQVLEADGFSSQAKTPRERERSKEGEKGRKRCTKNVGIGRSSLERCNQKLSEKIFAVSSLAT